jgi:hypothetical protein
MSFKEGIEKTISWYMSDYGKKWLEKINVM